MLVQKGGDVGFVEKIRSFSTRRSVVYSGVWPMNRRDSLPPLSEKYPFTEHEQRRVWDGRFGKRRSQVKCTSSWSHFGVLNPDQPFGHSKSFFWLVKLSLIEDPRFLCMSFNTRTHIPISPLDDVTRPTGMTVRRTVGTTSDESTWNLSVKWNETGDR